MKARHIVLLLVGAPLVVWALLSCDLGAISIDQRISTFQSDLNSSSRTNVYLDFHPTLTSEYNALKNPSLSGIDTEFPGASYTLSIVDESNPVSGVIVLVSGASPGSAYVGNWYLLLTMATYNNNDWRIVTLSDSQTTSGWTLRFY
ncbi:MAG: hypothetical protein ABSG17_00420 [Spirochaetia bacterium]|jgi:hypothetical protein